MASKMTSRTIPPVSTNFLLLLFAIFVALSTAEQTGADTDLPPVRTEVKYVENKDKVSDDPSKAWEEWGETEQTRKNPFPRRQRKIEVGMDIHTIMGMAMRQEKIVTAVLRPEFGANEQIGNMVTAKFKNQMAAAGIGCRLWFLLQGRQVVANCETIRDGHMAKDYMIRQREIMRTVIDNIPFTPKPTPSDDDDDDDDDDDNGDHKLSSAEQVKNSKEETASGDDSNDKIEL